MYLYSHGQAVLMCALPSVVELGFNGGVAHIFVNHVWKLHGFPRSTTTEKDHKFVRLFGLSS